MEEEKLKEAERERIEAEDRIASAKAKIADAEKDGELNKEKDVYQERVIFSKDTGVENIINEAAWTEYQRQNQSFANRERILALELNVLESKMGPEKERQDKLQFKIEGFRATETICSRQLRALKAKRQNLQAKQRAIVAWFKGEATGAYERERERATTLLALAAKMMEEKRLKALAIREAIKEWEQKSKAVKETLVQNTNKRDELQQIQTSILLGNETLYENYTLTNTELQSKVVARDDIIKKRRENEENRRVMEHKMFLQACNKASIDTQIELNQLQVFNFVELEIDRLPDFRKAPNIKYVNMDRNKFTTMEGLEALTDLAFISLNSNHINKLDMDVLKSIRHIEMTSNNITTVTVSCFSLLMALGNRWAKASTLARYKQQSY
jgi:hypothetical protein